MEQVMVAADISMQLITSVGGGFPSSIFLFREEKTAARNAPKVPSANPSCMFQLILPTTIAMPGRMIKLSNNSYHFTFCFSKNGSVNAEKNEEVAMVATATEALESLMAP